MWDFIRSAQWSGVAGALVVLLGASPLRGAEYFVAPDGADGNDGLSRAAAFATVQKGVDALAPGDTLTIAPGEFFGPVRRDGLGSAEAITTIRADIPGTVLLRGDVAAPRFRKLVGHRFVYMADFDPALEAQVVNELDTLSILDRMPNATELDFVPGKFHQDAEAGKLYISASDLGSPDEHTYTVSVVPTHGLYLSHATRVVVEGLAVHGFNAATQIAGRDHTLGSTWGIFIANGNHCVVRDCHVYMNGQGVGISSYEETSGDNAIERCTAWANATQYGVGDRGGLTLVNPRRDEIRDSVAFLNGHYGINIRGGGVQGQDKNNQSFMRRSMAWGNGFADIKIKTGMQSLHQTVRCVGGSASNAYNPVHCLLWRPNREIEDDSIGIQNEEGLDLRAEFADPDNRDYRLQATSRFRGTAPDGGDRGPFPYKPNIFYAKPNGDDTADGLSAANAWRTLARAIESLGPGDTLYLEPGTYQGGFGAALAGEQGAPVSIRGRGRAMATIRGGLRVEGGAFAEFQRLAFADGASLGEGRDIRFENCRFGGAGLRAEGVVALAASHCEFNAPLALEGCSGVDLRGNLFASRQGAGVRLDRLAAIKHSNYNGYANAAAAWETTGKPRSLTDIQQTHDRQSRGVADETPAAVATAGPFARPLGVYRNDPPEADLRLVRDPSVHSVSATTANIEWFTTLPATCEVAWGQTPACENSDSFDVNYFGSYSLTGLEPGRTYYFEIRSLAEPRGIVADVRPQEAPESEPVPVDSRTISFTTLAANPEPAVYYVAPDGDNSASGLSRDSAWRTIQRAADQANVGDTVFIAGGSYPEKVRIRATGDTGEPIAFKGLPGEKVVLTGAGKKLNQAFVVGGKNNLRFDALYFRDSNREPLSGRLLIGVCGEFNLYRCRDIEISRAFSDGRGGYSARFVTALQVENLTITNSVTMNKMSGALMIWRCPSLRIENSVLARQMISSFSLNNMPDQKIYLEDNIFTDMLQKKAVLNITFSEIEEIASLRMRNNSFFVRAFPPEERKIFSEVNHATRSVTSTYTIPELEASLAPTNTLFADPEFAGDPAKDAEGFAPDRLMQPGLDIDFDSFFATHPTVVERGIGLQPEAFEEFDFSRE